MLNFRQDTDPVTTSAMHFRHKRLLTALVIGLALRMLFLAGDGTLTFLAPERRIILILVALRLLIMLHSSLEIVEPTKPAEQPRYTGWQEGILPFFLIAPPMVVFWLAAWSTGGALLGITGYAIAASIMMLLLILNFASRLIKSSRKSLAENGDVRSQSPTGKFLVDILFFSAYGVILAFGIIGLMVFSPEALDDSIAIGNLAFYVYLMTWVIQGIFLFFSNLIRQAAVETGLRQ